MKRLVLFGAILLLGSFPVWAEDCQFVRVAVGASLTDVTPWEVEDLLLQCFTPAAIEQFEWCLSARLTGTLVGEWVVCGHSDWHIEDPWEVGFRGQMWMNPGVFRTARGNLCMMEHSVISWDAFTADRFLGVALDDITDGTGEYENATGWLAWHPYSDRSRGNSPVEGYICTP